MKQFRRTRRNFFATCAAAVVAPLVAVPEFKSALPPREFHRFVRALDKWVKIDPDEIRAEDVIWIFDPPNGTGENIVMIVREHDRVKEEIWAKWVLDPKTNKWV